MNITLNPTKKQSKCLKLLLDDKTNVVLFGGSAGGGKSYTGCLWITTLCLKYEGIRCLIGRTVLTQLKLTTLNTLFDLLNQMGLKSGEHYNFNGQSNVLTFYNKSEIIFKDLEDKPSDMNKDSLGSLELTAAFIDEAAQISQLTYSIIKSRIRYKLNEYKLIPKLLLTCNPSNNWIKKEFYIPYVQETLEPNKAFVPALPYDNPHLPPTYVEMLKELPPQQRRRLLEGDWDYLDESDSIFKFEEISNCLFKFVPNPNDKKWMTVDVARFGDDRSVVMIWVGLCLIECHVFRKLDGVQLTDEIKDLIKFHKIHPLQVIVDSDGVGGPISDSLRGTNFVNNSKPYHEQNFTNLKSQCYVKLGDYIKEGKISINLSDPLLVDDLTQELLVIKLKDLDKDKRISVQSKDEIKKVLGRSNDLSDCMMMRMLQEVKTLKASGRYAISII